MFPLDNPLELTLFPIKAENGLSLTTQELQSNHVCSIFNRYLENSDPFVRTVRAPDFAKIIGCAFSDNDEDEKIRIRRFPWLLVPTVTRSEIILNRRFTHKANQGRSQVMQNICEFYLDLYLGISPLDVDVVRFWGQTTVVALDAAPGQPSFAQQVSTDLKAHPDHDRFIRTRGQTTRELLDWFGLASERIREFVADAPDVALGQHHPHAAVNLLRNLHTPNMAVVDGWLTTKPNLLGLKPKEKKIKKGVSILFMSRDAKDLIEEIEDEEHPLHGSVRLIRSFLGSFDDERYQKLAVRMFRSYEPTDED